MVLRLHLSCHAASCSHRYTISRTAGMTNPGTFLEMKVRNLQQDASTALAQQHCLTSALLIYRARINYRWILQNHIFTNTVTTI